MSYSHTAGQHGPYTLEESRPNRALVKRVGIVAVLIAATIGVVSTGSFIGGIIAHGSPQPETCLLNMHEHDATMIVSGVGARAECSKMIADPASAYNFVRGTYDNNADRWSIDLGTHAADLSYVCSYTDKTLDYIVYDDGFQMYAGGMCRGLATNPSLQPLAHSSVMALPTPA